MRKRRKWRRRRDVVILALGGNEQTSREAWAVIIKAIATAWICWANQDELVKASAGDGEAGGGVFCNTGGRIPSIMLPNMFRRFWRGGIWGRKAERRWRT